MSVWKWKGGERKEDRDSNDDDEQRETGRQQSKYLSDSKSAKTRNSTRMTATAMALWRKLEDNSSGQRQ